MKPTVVLTRTEADSHRQADWLAGQGFAAVALPLLRIESVPGSSQRIPAEIDLAIFVSANAVRHSLPLTALESLPEAAVLAIGRRTAQQLAEAGIAAQCPEREDSEGLLALPALQSVAGKRVALFKGVGGRALIANTLRERGAEVCEVVCYQRHYLPLPPAQLASLLSPRRPLLWVAGSGGMVDHLGRSLARSAHPELQAEPIVVPSERVAGEAAAAGWPVIVTAADASDAALLAVLRRGDFAKAAMS